MRLPKWTKKRLRLGWHRVVGMNLLNKIHISSKHSKAKCSCFSSYVQYTGYCYVRSIRAKRRTEKPRPGRFRAPNELNYTPTKGVGSCYIYISLLCLYFFSNCCYIYIFLLNRRPTGSWLGDYITEYMYLFILRSCFFSLSLVVLLLNNWTAYTRNIFFARRFACLAEI
ncbi:hypothetical protein J3E69DRAFT_58348 [Trichoderma sp. SZMC 28015]